ncbi:uncharacterized protein LOC111083719 [Limulus polyphemus]|uniref:Uncharacterized protein LOC111083719 n=1 Tax=Limulus polyphemus TaxID=6850 RepID=A0ABM1RXI5_LIMPO|nr:uncharacterized protein LOC111083719 [Limulus polyphemus]
MLIPHLFTCDLCNIHNKLHADVSSLACRFLHVMLGPKALDELCWLYSVRQPVVDKDTKCEKETAPELGNNVEEILYSTATLSSSGLAESTVVMPESVIPKLTTQNTSGSSPYDQSSILSHSLGDKNLSDIQEKIQPTQTFPESNKVSQQIGSEEVTILLKDQLQPEFDRVLYTEETSLYFILTLSVASRAVSFNAPMVRSKAFCISSMWRR